MLTNQLVEDGDNYYYVDANGAMVKNTWVAIAADEDEEEDVDYRWYYFGSSGKAYKDSTAQQERPSTVRSTASMMKVRCSSDS